MIFRAVFNHPVALIFLDFFQNSFLLVYKRTREMVQEALSLH